MSTETCVSSLTEKINDAIQSRKLGAECSDITEELAMAISTNSQSEDLKALNYQWQTYVGKEYVREHRLDDFLESIVQHLLKEKSEKPLDEIMTFLNSKKTPSE